MSVGSHALPVSEWRGTWQRWLLFQQRDVLVIKALGLTVQSYMCRIPCACDTPQTDDTSRLVLLYDVGKKAKNR